MTSQEAADRIIDLLVSVRDIVAASFRSPQLLSAQMAKMAPDQRSTLREFSDRFRSVLSTATIVEPSSQLKRRRESSTESPAAMPLSPPTPAPTGDCERLFREAFVGVADTPNDAEYYPEPLVPGLIHGEPAQINALFQTYPQVLEFLQEEFEKKREAFDVLSEANMLWVGKYPLDFAASGKESAKWLALSSTSGGGHRKKPLATVMRHLLLLNLQLHYDAEQWIELISVRDRVIDILKKGTSTIPRCSPQVEEAIRKMDLALPALELIRIDASPDELKELLISKASAVVEVCNKVIKESDKGESFFSRLSAESNQARSVVAMIKGIVVEMKEEIHRVEDCSGTVLAASPPGSPRNVE